LYTQSSDDDFDADADEQEVLEAIAETAFKASDLPLILSFENHCSYVPRVGGSYAPVVYFSFYVKSMF